MALNISTYYTMDDMADVIRNAHQSARARHAAEGGENKPIMGHNVLVSMLWEMRDFWEWLVPGYTQDPKQAFNTAAFVSYDNLHQYRDFLIKREDGSTVQCPQCWPMGQTVHDGHGVQVNLHLDDQGHVR